VTQLVNYGVVGFHWPSIFIMGFFFGFGFALRATFRFNVWIASIIVAISIQFGALLTLGIGSNETSYFIDSLRPVFHYVRFEDYFTIGFVMTWLQAVGVYAVTMWQDVRGIPQRAAVQSDTPTAT
jgi:hypothetical protein